MHPVNHSAVAASSRPETSVGTGSTSGPVVVVVVVVVVERMIAVGTWNLCRRHGVSPAAAAPPPQ